MKKMIVLSRKIFICFIIIFIGIFLCIYFSLPSSINSNNKIAHLSFDDVYEVLIDITENEDKYNSIFDNNFLRSLKIMHDNYGAKFVLYIYDKYPEKNYDITKVSTKYKLEFQNNSNWLKFGYHTIEPDTRFDKSFDLKELIESYKRVNDAILNFAGVRSTNVIRLNYFSGKTEVINFLSRKGVFALLCADDKRASYSLSENQNNKLLEQDYIVHQGMRYIKTDFRFDGKKLIIYEMLKLRDNEIMVLFAHEWALGPKDLDKIYKAVKWLYKNGYKFSFLE